MPSLFTSSSAAKGSTRRPRGESESHRPASHRVDSERRRAKETSKNNDRRSPPSKTNSAAASVYNQPSIPQDQSFASTASESESALTPQSSLSPQSSISSAQQYQLETPQALMQYLDTEDEDATPQPKKELSSCPPVARSPAQTSSAPVSASVTAPATATAPSANVAAFLQSRPMTPEAHESKDDNATVTGSPQHMSMSMPQLQRDVRSDDEPAQPPPIQTRAFTPPVAMHSPMHQKIAPQLAQPMPVYPYPNQDPRSYYTQPMQSMQMQPQQHRSPQLQHLPQQMPQQHVLPQLQQHIPQQQPSMSAGPLPPHSGYMYEPQYDEPRYQDPRYDLASRHAVPYYNSSQSPGPDPYRHHRLSMASAGAESQYTQDNSDRGTVASHGHQAGPGTGRTSPQDENTDLLSRIQTALPDLQLLLSRCEEVAGHGSSHREPKLLTSGAGEDAHVDELLKQKTTRIEELEKELVSKTQSHVSERNKMRFEIGNLQEQYRDLQEDLVTFKRDGPASASSKTLVDDTVDIRRDLDLTRRKARELEEAKVVTDRLVSSLEAQVRSLSMQLLDQKGTENTLQIRLKETSDAHARERATLVAAAAAASSPGAGKGEGLRDVNESLAREKRDLEVALRAKDNRLEESRKVWLKDIEEARSRGTRELEEGQKLWTAEKQEILKLNDEATAKLKAEYEREGRSVARKHEKALVELERGLEAKFDEQYKELEAEVSRTRRDYKRVKRDWHVDKERAYEERGKLRAAALKMQAEHAGLMRLLEVYSEPTERDREREKKEAERESREGREGREGRDREKEREREREKSDGRVREGGDGRNG